VHREIDLQVGDVLRVGTQCLIVVEAHDGEVTFKICADDDLETASEWSCPPPK